MSFRTVGVIQIPESEGTLFDHGAFEPRTRRVFAAHTARDRLEVIDHETLRHLASLDGFAGAAGVVADEGSVLVTNRGGATLAWVDAESLKTRAVLTTGPRPNGVAFVPHLHLAVVACIGDETRSPELQVFDLDKNRQWSLRLAGRPRWCVTDAAGERVFLAIRDPAAVLVARLPDLSEVRYWTLPSTGAHGIDIDREAGQLYVACDGGALIQVRTADGKVGTLWPLAGVPDATFVNPFSGRVHVAIGEAGLVQSVDPQTGANASFATAPGAQTTALVPPDFLYVFSTEHRGVLVLQETVELPPAHKTGPREF
jgi:DNA-binding beta-propeller fold protein YncE